MTNIFDPLKTQKECNELQNSTLKTITDNGILLVCECRLNNEINEIAMAISYDK